MINEMDLLRMDERQRAAWLLANRATVMLVGLTWLAMIVWELAHSRSPGFLIVMVPVFAFFRLGTYLVYLRSVPASRRESRISLVIRIVAAGVLAISAFVPLYRFTDRGVTGLQVALEDLPNLALMAFAFLWPLAALAAARVSGRRAVALAVQFAEPLLAACSTLVLLWIPQLVWEYDTTFAPWLLVPKETAPAVGVLLAVAANGLYVVGWLGGLLGSSRQSR